MIDIFSRGAVRQGAALASSEKDDESFPSLKHARGMSSDDLVSLIERSGLTGKGGAVFPTYRKIDLLRRQASDQKYLVINGSEHEPGSLKDRYLLERHAASVLEGALILAHAAGVCEVLITINEGAPVAISEAKAALEQFAGGAGNGNAAVSVKVVAVPDSYMVGEESALLEVLEGRASLPRKKPPFPVEKGLNGFPTLVQNVETVAHLPFILAHGADTYRSLGVNGAGVTLCTFGTEFENSGVRTVPLGISVRELIYGYGGGLKSGMEIKAVQPGGPSAGFLTASQFDTPFLDEPLKFAGSALGCASIRAYSQADDMIAVVAEIAEFFADNSCGQCPQCRMETQMLSTIMKQTLFGRGNPRLLKQIPVIIKASVGKGICGLIKMPVDPILSAMKNFGSDFERYMVEAERTQ
jgi:NADH:ubiquinone oxidoreductase subunit F (NADH-binding)